MNRSIAILTAMAVWRGDRLARRYASLHGREAAGRPAPPRNSHEACVCRFQPRLLSAAAWVGMMLSSPTRGVFSPAATLPAISWRDTIWRPKQRQPTTP